MYQEDNIGFISKIIDSWEEFDELIGSFNYRDWVYRGQASANWQLQSSLVRMFNDAQQSGIKLESYLFPYNAMEEYEQVIIQRFMSGASLYLKKLPDINNEFEWLSIMQHYGVPTRLIDVTFSPHIACFFAMIDSNEDSAVYALEHKWFEKTIDERFDGIKDIKNEYGLITYEPKYLNERLKAQQGLFLIPNTLESCIEDDIMKTKALEDSFYKIIIPKELIKEGRSRLRKMNLTYSTLFPGIEGFSKSIKDIVYEDRSIIERFSPIIRFE